MRIEVDTFSPTSWLPGWGEGLEVESVVSDQWFNQSCLCNEACNKTTKGGGSESFQAGVPEPFHVPLRWAPVLTRTEDPLFGTSPYVSLHLAVDSYPLTLFVTNW